MEVADWMVRNQLKLNKDKSQAIIFHTVKQSPHVPVDTYVNLAGQRVRLATSVCNLVVLFDSALTMESKVASVAKSCYSRTPLIRPPSESHWCGRIRGMVARA